MKNAFCSAVLTRVWVCTTENIEKEYPLPQRRAAFQESEQAVTSNFFVIPTSIIIYSILAVTVVINLFLNFQVFKPRGTKLPHGFSEEGEKRGNWLSGCSLQSFVNSIETAERCKTLNFPDFCLVPAAWGCDFRESQIFVFSSSFSLIRNCTSGDTPPNADRCSYPICSLRGQLLFEIDDPFLHYGF